MRFGLLSVSTSTGATGSPQLRVTVPCAIDDLEEVRDGSTDLDRREVEALVDFLQEWLR